MVRETGNSHTWDTGFAVTKPRRRKGHGVALQGWLNREMFPRLKRALPI